MQRHTPEKWTEFVSRSLPDSGRISLEPLHGDASRRAFYRVRGACRPCVLMVNPDPPVAEHSTVNENDTYVYLASLLDKVAPGCPPAVFGYDRDNGLILLEDLGESHLQAKVLETGVESAWTENVYSRLLELLVTIQVEGGAIFDPCRSFNPEYDAAFMYQAEGLYFAHYFVNRLCGITQPGLKGELKKLSRETGRLIGVRLLLYRDFQSRNVMLGEADKLRLLDFQGARIGPPAYDLASLVFDPYLPLPDKLRGDLIAEFAELLSRCSKKAASEFTCQFPFIAAHRLMQVLGAYAKLSLIDARTQFLQYVPRALQDLKTLLQDEQFSSYQLLRELSTRLEVENLKQDL